MFTIFYNRKKRNNTKYNLLWNYLNAKILLNYSPIKTSFNLSNIFGKESIFPIFKIKILFRQRWTTLYYKSKQYPSSFSPLSSTKELQPSAEPWIMNTRRSIGRVYFRSIWIFTVNLFCRGKTGRMNRWIMIADEQDSFFEFSCVIAFLGDCGFQFIRQCFLLLRMHTNNFHPPSL